MRTKNGIVLFYGGWPSNFYPADFTIDGITYWCGEQWMMAEKARLFGDTAMLEKILAEKKSQWKIKLEYGRNIKPFDKAKWEAVARDLVYKGLLEKFRQNPDLRAALRLTGSHEIVEASPTDCIWGIGLAEDNDDAFDKTKWRGTNWLGEVIMRVRDTLNAEAVS